MSAFLRLVPVLTALSLVVSCKGGPPNQPSPPSDAGGGSTTGPTAPEEAPTPIDGRFAFSSTREGAISLYVAEGLDIRLLTRGDNASWSRDGRIAFDRDGQILVINADGTGERALGPGGQPDWSPDGTKIAFVRGDFAAGNAYTVSVYVMSADGSGVTKLVDTTRLPAAVYSYAQTPSWSPDGRRIAFVHVPGDGESGALYIVDADGTNFRLLGSPFEPRTEPSWSPDGLTIGVVGHNASKIDLVNVDGSGNTEVVGDRHIVNGRKTPDNTLFFCPDWTRDGRLVYSRSTQRGQDLRLRLFVGGDGTEHPILAEARGGGSYNDTHIAVEP